MTSKLSAATAALNTLADSISNVTTDERPFTDMWGWQCPPLTRHELAARPRMLADRVGSIAAVEIDKPLEAVLDQVPERLRKLQSSIPQLTSGHAAQVVAVVNSTLDWIEQALPAESPEWEDLAGTDLLPKGLARRLRSVDSHIKRLVPKAENLSEQVDRINKAHEAAEALPTDLQSLAEAREEVKAFSKEVSENAAKVSAALESVAEALKKVREKEAEAAQLVKNCEAAYSVTTTKGLAGAFEQRAGKLSLSMWAWVVGLLTALVAGVVVGTQRFELLQQSLVRESPLQVEIVLINAILSVLSVAAPVWFAWLATKQIGQRFRLAEDYAFKASVAKAYEGYRREAARIDSAFEARLFGSALTRLEEAPLRLVEPETHGSPWNELTNSGAFKVALSKVPSLNELYSGLIDRARAPLPRSPRRTMKVDAAEQTPEAEE